MDSVVFLGGREASTIKEISENWLGKATISMQTDSRSRGPVGKLQPKHPAAGPGADDPSRAGYHARETSAFCSFGACPRSSLPKYDLKQHPNYKYTAEADKQKNAFDLDKLINRRRRPGLNEACDDV